MVIDLLLCFLKYFQVCWEYFIGNNFASRSSPTSRVSTFPIRPQTPHSKEQIESMASKRNVAKKDGDKEAIGSERLVSDKRQLAGMLMVLGFCAVIQPIANVAVYIQPDGATPTQGIQFAQFFGGVCLLAIGAGSVAAGFSELVYGWANFKIYGWLALLTQTA